MKIHEDTPSPPSGRRLTYFYPSAGPLMPYTYLQYILSTAAKSLLFFTQDLQRHSSSLRIKSSLNGSMWFWPLPLFWLHLVSCPQTRHFLGPPQSPLPLLNHAKHVPTHPGHYIVPLLGMLFSRYWLNNLLPIALFSADITHWQGLPWPLKSNDNSISQSSSNPYFLILYCSLPHYCWLMSCCPFWTVPSKIHLPSLSILFCCLCFLILVIISWPFYTTHLIGVFSLSLLE